MNTDTLELETVVADNQDGRVVTTQPETVAENEVTTKVDGRHLNTGRKPKVYNIHINNTVYLDYLATLGENTQYQYGLTIKNFLSSLGQKTPKSVSAEELAKFVGSSSVKRVHIRGFYLWMFEVNLNNIKKDIQREVLFWLF